MRYQQEDDRLVIQVGKPILALSIWLGSLVTFCLVLMVIGMITRAISQPRSLGEAFKWFMFFFVSIAFIIFSVWCLFGAIGYQIVIDSKGVREERKFYKNRCRVFRWRDIPDWGCTYVTSRKGRTIYWIYFADIVLPMKYEFDKKVDKECIWIAVTEKELKELYSVVMPFCRCYTSVSPFRSPSVKSLFGEYYFKK